MVIEIVQTIGFGERREARRLALRVDVERHRAIQALDLRLGLRPLEVRKLRRARLLNALAAVRDVDLALVAGDGKLLAGGFRLHVLPEVVVHALALDGQRLYRFNAAPSA